MLRRPPFGWRTNQKVHMINAALIAANGDLVSKTCVWSLAKACECGFSSHWGKFLDVLWCIFAEAECCRIGVCDIDIHGLHWQSGSSTKAAAGTQVEDLQTLVWMFLFWATCLQFSAVSARNSSSSSNLCQPSMWSAPSFGPCLWQGLPTSSW